jgi:hypothetical protein
MAMVIRLITQTFVWFGAMGILLFIAAGTFAPEATPDLPGQVDTQGEAERDP